MPAVWTHVKGLAPMDASCKDLVKEDKQSHTVPSERLFPSSATRRGAPLYPEESLSRWRSTILSVSLDVFLYTT